MRGWIVIVLAQRRQQTQVFNYAAAEMAGKL
jgi:hypothetical protein